MTNHALQPRKLSGRTLNVSLRMKMFPCFLVFAFCVGCAHTNEPFVQDDIRIIPPVMWEGETNSPQTFMFSIFNDGGTRWVKITDAEGKKFDVYVDHRIGSKTPRAIYLIDYPGKSNSVMVVNRREFNRKIGVFE